MKSFLQKLDEESKTKSPVVMAFGRMNPVTTGHEKLVNRVKEIAQDYRAPHVVVVSHSVDSKKNPLMVKDKLKHARRFFPNTNIIASDKEKPTFLQHAAALNAAGHDHLVMVAGSDRVPEYEQKLKQYNGTSPGSLYNFKKIEVKSAGQRDPDSDSVEGMSASKMREHAKNNDFISFKGGVPKHVPENHARELFRDVRKGMGINENYSRGMFKAIFVTGGPGSGKDIILREAISENKAVELNVTQIYEYLQDKMTLAEKTNDYRRDSIKNRMPLIINGPADLAEKMVYIKEELEELGYETMMVFVDTSNETSKERNMKLAKMVSESIRQEKWMQSQKHKSHYRNNFSNFVHFNNNGNFDELEEQITDTYQKINTFIETQNFNESAYLWFKGNENKIITVKENENVKTNSRLVERYKLKRETSTGLYTKNSSSGTAPGPADITPDNRASDPSTDDIRWDAPKRRGSYIFRTYSEEDQATYKVQPQPKETNFSKDKEKIKRKGKVDMPTVSQRLRNLAGIGPEFDTRQQGTVYPMSGLGDVTYREQKEFRSFRTFREDYNDPSSSSMGLAGVLSGSSNKEPLENVKDKLIPTVEISKKKKKK
jgi:cytidyltransferase-like protein